MFSTPALPKHVCWHSWDDWRAVKAQLFSTDAKEVEHGLARLGVWQTRAPLPVAIESTAALLVCAQRDAEYNAGSSSIHELELRLLMSSAVMRMVNGLTDTLQTKVNAQSVLALADELALPSGAVTIRHLTAHNQLPYLPVLRLMVKRCLQWLQQRYWTPQEANLSEFSNRIAASLDAYKRSFKAKESKMIERMESGKAKNGISGVTNLRKKKNEEETNDSNEHESWHAPIDMLVAAVGNHLEGIPDLTKVVLDSRYLCKAPVKASLMLTSLPLLSSERSTRVGLVFKKLQDYWACVMTRLLDAIPSLHQSLLLAICAEVSALVNEMRTPATEWRAELLVQWGVWLCNVANEIQFAHIHWLASCRQCITYLKTVSHSWTHTLEKAIMDSLDAQAIYLKSLTNDQSKHDTSTSNASNTNTSKNKPKRGKKRGRESKHEAQTTAQKFVKISFPRELPLGVFVKHADNDDAVCNINEILCSTIIRDTSIMCTCTHCLIPRPEDIIPDDHINHSSTSMHGDASAFTSPLDESLDIVIF